ncbi:hypothetical protein SDC9_81506 [bioreactor metagenome]|uniref:Uncharacterized protein n=1 Tax=bioreactor metagenome TaxID=1076179 RepID=A0A644Z250_9ZZZZ
MTITRFEKRFWQYHYFLAFSFGTNPYVLARYIVLNFVKGLLQEIIINLNNAPNNAFSVTQ